MLSSSRTFLHLLIGCLGALAAAQAMGQSTPPAPSVDKIDPPGWFAGFPKPLLLLHGSGLHDVAVSLSDSTLRVERMQASDNGHWLLVWLGASPDRAEQVNLRLKPAHGGPAIDVPYTFAARKPVKVVNGGFAGFNSRDLLYLIMPDRFADGDRSNDGERATSVATSDDAAAERAKPRGWHGGDLRGVMDHLDYIQALGMTAVWLTPVYQNHEQGSYHGYGATDLYAVDEHYGSMADLQALSDALHRRGMKLVLDMVPNHIGPAHPWVTDEPTPTWFHGTQAHHLPAEYDFRALINPHASDAARDATLHGWFANLLPDMDTDDATVAQYLRQNTDWWIEMTGADGLRIDTFPYVDRPFWAAYTQELLSLWPRMTEVGEVENPDAEITSSFAGGVTRAGVDTGLWTPFDYPSYFALYDVFVKRSPMSKLAGILAQDALYPHPERLVPFLGNHDVPRFADAADAASQRLAFGVVFTMRGMPQLYAGDEIAMKGGGDPENRHDFPGGFSGLAGEPTHDAFLAAGRTPAEDSVLTWVTKLSHLHAAEPALACGAEQVLYSDADTLVSLRDTAHASGCAQPSSQERIIVAVHRGPAAPLSVPLKQTWAAGCRPGSSALTGMTQATASNDLLKLQLAADDVWIARCE